MEQLTKMINLTLSLLSSTIPKTLRFSALQFQPPLAATHLHFPNKERRTFSLSSAYTDYSPTQFDQPSSDDSEELNAAQRKALLKGGEQVVSVMQQMLDLVIFFSSINFSDIIYDNSEFMFDPRKVAKLQSTKRFSKI